MTLTSLEWLIDGLVPPPHDVFTPLGYRPNCRPQQDAAELGITIPPCGQCPQERFHAMPGYSQGGPWDLLFGGAMGGGKTKGLVMDAVNRVCKHPGLEAWVVRQTYPDLERDVIPHLEQLGYCATLGGKWHGGQRTLTFPRFGGSKIRFLHARNVAEAASVRGECQVLYVDERSRIDPDVIDTLALRVRSGHASIPVIGIRGGTNPGGVGHSTLKGQFIDPAPSGDVELEIISDEGRVVRENPKDPTSRPLTRYFLPSKADDNPHLDSSYYARFDMMSADTRAAYRDGDWSKFEGMRFAEFTMGIHVVSASSMPLDLAEVQTGVGVDWGSDAPFAAVWGALINGGESLVIYRELHQAGLKVSEQAALIRSVMQDVEDGQPVWVDPSTWTTNPEDPRSPRDIDHPPSGSIAAGYMDGGVPVRKANNARVSGWALLEELLTIPDDWGQPTDEPRFLRLYVYDTCPNFIRSLSGAPRDPKNPEDVDGGYKDDHSLDAGRYLAMGLLGSPQRGDPIINAGARAAAMRVMTGVR